LGTDQLDALGALLAPLRRSAAALRHQLPDDSPCTLYPVPCTLYPVPPDRDPAAPSGWVARSGSNPPSPPGTAGRMHAGRWSTHLCACLTDPMSCVSGLLCWPILAGQLGQKIVGLRNLCLCFALPMLVFFLMNAFASARNLLGLGEYSEIAEGPHASRSDYFNFALNATSDDGENSSISFAALVVSIEGWLGVQMGMNVRDFILWLSGLGLGAGVVWKTMLRMLVRQRDAIPGSPLRDLCISTSCFCLSICQLARHEGLAGSRYGIVSPTGEKKPHARVAVMAV